MKRSIIENVMQQIGVCYLFVPKEGAERCQSQGSGRFPFLLDVRMPLHTCELIYEWEDAMLGEIIQSQQFREYGVDCPPESFSNVQNNERLARLADNYRIFGRTQ